jgi:tetratricopeptide (TPR) repeat protein
VTVRAAVLPGVLLLANLLPAAARGGTTAAEQSVSAEMLFNRGNAYRQQYLRERTLSEHDAEPRGKPPAQLALESYSAAIRMRPDFAAAYVNRAAVHYESGDYAAAIADCDAALRIEPTLAEAFNNRSLAYYKSDRYAEAKADFDRTIRLHQFYGNAMIVRTLPDIDLGRSASG